MRHISILIPKGHTSIVNIEGTQQILSEVNTILASRKEPPLFKIVLAGITGTASQRNGTFSISPDVMIKNIKKTDLIIVPAIYGKPEEIIKIMQNFYHG